MLKKNNLLVFLISNFGRVLNIVYVLLGISPASDCGQMELTEGSETSANHTLTPGKCPKKYIKFISRFPYKLILRGSILK
jgi:hypothetical protein